MSTCEEVDAKEDEEINVHNSQPSVSPSPSHHPSPPPHSPHNADAADDAAPIRTDATSASPVTLPPSPPPPPSVNEPQDEAPRASDLKDRSPVEPLPHHNTTIQSNPNGLHPLTQPLKLVPQDEGNGLSKQVSPAKNPLPFTQKPLSDEEIQEMNPSLVKEPPKPKSDDLAIKTPTKSYLFDNSLADGYESGTEEEQAAFLKDVENFYRENNLEFKAPKFYKEELNLLKLWRAVIKLGGYEQVTSCKLWRQVGESFRPPKTCTTVSWTFRIFYEKALHEYEKSKMRNGELPFSDGPTAESVRIESQPGGSQALGSGRARRDAAARAMQGWHSQRLLGNGQVFHPIVKDKNLSSISKSDKQLKTNGLLKRKRPSAVDHAFHVGHMKTMKPQGDAIVIDIGPPADWVKINVQRTNDCFEIYALVPGLLREEVHVQSDPAGRLIISGQPEQLDNPWGVTPFKKVVSLPSRIDPHQTSAVVTLHGQLFVHVPLEQSDP